MPEAVENLHQLAASLDQLTQNPASIRDGISEGGSEEQALG